MQRKDAILLAATDHFGRFGFRGASLRDIARDAGVSLTLLNHHFGCKSRLLSAVVETHRPVLQRRAAAAQRVSCRGSGAFAVRDLLHAWVRVDFETAARPDGEMALRFLGRVMDDPAEEVVPVVQDRLAVVTLACVDALQQCYPRAPHGAAVSACLWIDACLLASFVGADRLFFLSGANRSQEPAGEYQLRLVEFLAGGVDAAMRHFDAVAAIDPGADPSAPNARRSREFTSGSAQPSPIA